MLESIQFQKEPRTEMTTESVAFHLIFTQENYGLRKAIYFMESKITLWIEPHEVVDSFRQSGGLNYNWWSWENGPRYQQPGLEQFPPTRST